MSALLGDTAVKVIIGIITAIAVYYVTEMVKARYRVVQMTSRNRNKYYTQFANLYCDRIESEQQIYPSIIADHAVDKKISPRSRRQLKRMGKGSAHYPTAHQLYLAVQKSKVLGFLCILINLQRSYVFVAYVGVVHSPEAPGDIMQRMLNKAHQRVREILASEVYLFEVAPPISEATTSRAKFRLFRDYAKRLSLAAYRLPVAYIQPDMDPESLDGSTEALADLCIASADLVANSPSRDSALRYVWSVYFDIYLRSFPDLDLQPKYLDYLKSLYSLIEGQNA